MWTLDKNKQIDKKNQTTLKQTFSPQTQSLTKLSNTLYTHFIICQITEQCTIHQMLIFNQKKNECKLCLQNKKDKAPHKPYFPIHLHTNNYLYISNYVFTLFLNRIQNEMKKKLYMYQTIMLHVCIHQSYTLYVKLEI